MAALGEAFMAKRAVRPNSFGKARTEAALRLSDFKSYLVERGACGKFEIRSTDRLHVEKGGNYELISNVHVARSAGNFAHLRRMKT